MKSQIIGKTVVLLERVASTNNYATDQVRENEVEEGTVFLADDQSAGRGHLANKWESEPGKNLTFSIYIRPKFLPVDKTYLLSKVVCLGIESFLTQFVENVKIKWPNDIYVDDRKICGILIENGIMHNQICQSIIGIGLNINQVKFYSDAPNPVSLTQLTGEQYDLLKLIKSLLQQIDFHYRRLVGGEADEINRQFVSKMYRMNEWHWYKDKNHTYKGMIIGVNEIGQLKVEEEDGTLNEYHFKEVEYLTNRI